MTTPSTFRSPWGGAATPEETAHWAAIAETAASALAVDALARDRGDASTRDALDILRAAGFANLLIPTAWGGAGAHWETAFLVLRILGRADASVAQVLGYHYLNQGCITFYGGDEAAQEHWYRASAVANHFWSDSFNPVSPDLSFVADGENYRLSGLKRFATGAAVTDVIIAGGVAEGGVHDGELVVFAIDANRAGVEHLDDWDNLGQRASASGSVRYTDVVVTPATSSASTRRSLSALW